MKKIKEMKKIILILMVSIGIFLLGGCSDKSEKNVLIVGTNAEFAPFEYMNGNEIKGFDIDLINEIGKKIGKKIEIKNISFDGLLPALQSKKIDLIIAGMTATEERKKHVNFTQSYYTSQQALIVDDSKVKNIEELSGKKIGVVLGYTGDVFISSKPNYQIQRYNSSSGAIMALQGKKVQAVILDKEPAIQYVKQNKGLYVVDIDGGKEEYSIALNKDEKKLLEKIEKALLEMKQDGTYKTIYNKYFN